MRRAEVFIQGSLAGVLERGGWIVMARRSCTWKICVS